MFDRLKTASGGGVDDVVGISFWERSTKVSPDRTDFTNANPSRGRTACGARVLIVGVE